MSEQWTVGCLLLLFVHVCTAHYLYPGLPPIFTHQSHQSIFQGASSSSFGFGGLGPINGAIQLGKPETSFSASYQHGGNGGFPTSSIQAFIQAGGGGGVGSTGGNGPTGTEWGYPESPFPFGKPYPPPDGPITNELKPSLTDWETNYKVPCGVYKIHPTVVAHLRYNSGVPFEISAMAKSGLMREERSDVPTTSIPESPTAEPKGSKRQGRHMDFSTYYNMGATCTWDFHATGNCKLKFSCPWFQLPALFQCEENMIELTDAEQTSYKFCGNRKPRGSYTTTTDNLKLTFSSRPYSLPSLFHCTVQCVPDDSTTTPEPTTEATTKEPVPLKYGKCKCGVQRSYSSGRIVGGSRTGPGEFPWTVALVKQKSNRPFCGGALINSQYVLSAAHCVQHSSMICDKSAGVKKYVADIEVLLNEHDLSGANKIGGGPVRSKVSYIVMHPQYDNFTYNYDVAILRLEKAIEFAEDCNNDNHGSKKKKVSGGRAITEEVEKLENKFESQFVPICLPPKERTYAAFDGAEGIVTGWGYTQERGIPSNSMMQAIVTIYNDSMCQDFYRSTDVVTKQMLCAGHPEGKMDSCVGDSGGPLGVKEKDQYILAGLVSWGRGCGRPNLPGVYTRMSGLTEWIESETADAIWCHP